MHSPNSPTDDIRTLRAAQGIMADTPKTGSKAPTMVVPQLRTVTNLRLQWSEWSRIALFSGLSLALVIEAIMQAAATAWFGDPTRALMPLGVLIVTVLCAMLTLRLIDTRPGLQRLMPIGMGLGTVITALLLIRTLVFPALAPNDWSWLASFQTLADANAERPHAELGMIFMSALIWLIAERIVRNAGDYELRRRAFLRYFVLMIAAIILGLWSAQGNDTLSVSLALYLPTYVLLGMLMMAQVRLSEVRARMARSGTMDRRSLRVWQTITVGLVGVTLLLVFVLTAIFYVGSYQHLLQNIGDVWGHTVDGIAFIVVWFTLPFVVLLGALLSNGGATKSGPGMGTPTAQPNEPPLSQSTIHILYTSVLIAVLVVLAIILLVRSLRRTVPLAEEGYEEVREALPHSRLPRPARSSLPDDRLDAPPAGTVRATYRDFLRQNAQAGIERDPLETPNEYATRIQLYVADIAPPDATGPAVAQLTQAYNDERYGAVPTTPTRFAQAQAWLRHIGAKLRKRTI